ncbi:hypothetical protein LP125_009 [Listeria phage LP-125]|uniref:Uncharacterized protein n=4 Tax=Pecentumvirus TaxID=1857844 RepID=S4U806_9CAUD|nr:gp179 [Listeria phage A511]YP_008239980.1 hypothetical protein QLX35_gp010 [Listeria phage LP-125]YP_009592539.1 hypothetical protein FDG78_gp010 [Listeria phage LP-064]QNL32144.1 hypothetical protein HUK30_0182 [Listeria phage LP-Mix_6.2]AAY52960.1 gp179 [Listeria phage A511]AGI11334.1 hypothetical protein LP125_009 [Listeria phage LP-125]AHL19030.1 hypothetical protein LP064_010 [Listeria phage LP-064]
MKNNTINIKDVELTIRKDVIKIKKLAKKIAEYYTVKKPSLTDNLRVQLIESEAKKLESTIAKNEELLYLMSNFTK